MLPTGSAWAVGSLERLGRTGGQKRPCRCLFKGTTTMGGDAGHRA